MKKFLKMNFTNRVPLGVPISLSVFTANYGLVLIITSETELEISGACCAKVLIEKRFEKGPRDALRLHRGQDKFELKKALSLDRLEIASKSNIKINEKVKV